MTHVLLLWLWLLLLSVVMLSLLCVAGLLIWLFVGLPSRIPFEPTALSASDAASDDEIELGESVTKLDDGSYTITCIDIYSRAHNDARNAQSLTIA